MRSTERSADGGAAVGGAASTVERIRDAAIARFGRDGFSAGLRAVAADAGVTAGLVVHHFGSKEGLRKACDEYVLGIIRSEKMRAATTGTAAGMIAQLAEVDMYAPLALYALRSLQAGGELAVAFTEQMVRDAEDYLAAGVEAGVIKPSRDPAARARYLAIQGLGSLLLWATLQPGELLAENFTGGLKELSDEVTAPALELFTQGLFVNRGLLDDYLMYVTDPPAETAEAGPAAPAEPAPNEPPAP